MNDTDYDPYLLMIRKLDRMAKLDQVDRDAIRALPLKVRHAPALHHLVREGDLVNDCCVLLDGYACRHKVASNGGRQIVSFHMPGDVLDLQHLLLRRADHGLQAITAITYATVPAGDIKQLGEERPVVGDALWRDTLIDASIFREWVLNVGRRSGKARVAHMMCEFAARREAAGLGGPEQFELPMSQEQIGDATGLTGVHVNRMLNELGQDGVIVRDKRKVEITNWDAMCRIADFDPGYLHMAA